MTLSSTLRPSTSCTGARRRFFTLCAVALLCGTLTTAAHAQRTFHETYKTRSDVRLELENLSGSVRVEVWQQPKIEIRAEMEKATRINPTVTDGGVVIDVLRDNGGLRGDLGNINFYVKVPVGSSVALRTKMGNITVNGVRGNFVRASVTLEGDIELIGINVNSVSASSRMGNIFFGGELRSGGNYVLESRQGDINIVIPTDSRFDLTANAPVTRRIELGPFAHHFPSSNDGRRTHGAVGGGGAMLAVTNTRGAISFRR